MLKQEKLLKEDDLVKINKLARKLYEQIEGWDWQTMGTCKYLDKDSGITAVGWVKDHYSYVMIVLFEGRYWRKMMQDRVKECKLAPQIYLV